MHEPAAMRATEPRVRRTSHARSTRRRRQRGSAPAGTPWCRSRLALTHTVGAYLRAIAGIVSSGDHRYTMDEFHGRHKIFQEDLPKIERRVVKGMCAGSLRRVGLDPGPMQEVDRFVLIVPPGSPAQAVHTDLDGPMAAQYATVGIPIGRDTTADNGATRVYRCDPDGGGRPAAVMTASISDDTCDAVCWRGDVYHCGGANHTARERTMLFIAFAAPGVSDMNAVTLQQFKAAGGVRVGVRQ